MANEDFEQKYGSVGKYRYENWMMMLENIQRDRSYKRDEEIQNDIQRLIQAVEDDRRGAFKKINFLDKLKIAGVVLIVLFVLLIVLAEVFKFGIFGWWGITFFAGVLLIVIGVKGQKSPTGILIAAKDFEDQYLK